MSNCCNSDTQTVAARKTNCPCCNGEAAQVGITTLLHQIRAPLNRNIEQQQFYFCSAQSCTTVYFSQCGTTFTTEQLRDVVGQKSTAPDRPLCYCFAVNLAAVEQELAQLNHSPSYAFVRAQTKAKHCACEVRNPSGKCCLKDFPTAAKQALP